MCDILIDIGGAPMGQGGANAPKNFKGAVIFDLTSLPP